MSLESSLQGSRVVTAYRSGDMMVEPDDLAEPSILIDGSLIAGTMGVNRFSAQIDDRHQIGPLVSTRMAGPAGLMRQEDTLLEHLQGTDAVEVAGDGMFLSRDGLLLVELERSTTDETV